MKKFYLLDTNILLNTNGQALYGFDDNTVVLTDRVIEELDNINHDKTNSERKYEVRSTIRVIDAICKFNKVESPIKKRVTRRSTPKPISEKTNMELKLPNGGKIMFVFDGVDSSLLPKGWEPNKVDNTIIATAVKMSKEHPRTPVIVVTNDRLMKIKCTLADIPAQEYKNEIVLKSIDDEYKGRIELFTSAEYINILYSQKSIDNIDEIIKINSKDHPIELFENEYVRLMSCDMNSSALCIYRNNKFNIIENSKKYYDKEIGLTPKNEGQLFALDALTRPCNELPLVILKGCAGSGKTLLAIAAGIKAVEKGKYGRVIVTRSNTIPEQEDLGALPGDLRDKMSYLLDPFRDNLEFITGNRDALDEMIDRGEIEITSMGFIRGRSIRDAYIIIDESQNITPMQMKTLITRTAVGSKLVILGDVTQRDNDKLSERSNGLIYASEKMKGSSLTGQVLFNENESVRSDLAKDAIKRL